MQLTTFVSTGTSAAVASAASGSSRSLGLRVALGGTGRGLVDGLDGDNGLVLARVVVAYNAICGQPGVNWAHKTKVISAV